MDRRKFLSLASLAGLAVASTDAFGRPGRPETLGKNPTPLFESYKGPFYIMVNAGGGWDPTSLCDPKGAASAEDSEAMNRSYLTKDIGVTPSGIRYAPLGSMDNPTYFPPEVQANPRFQERLAREVPLGRLVGAREDAQFAAYLCSSAADCFVGQVFPLCGGWVAR